MDDQFRSLFWSVKHTQWTLPDTPVVLSGDANVWWPEFHLGWERPRDRFFPNIHELLEGCGLSQKPFCVAVNMVFISEECVTEYFLLFTKEMVVALSHLVAQRSDLITFYVTSLLWCCKVSISMFGMHRAQLLFQLSGIGNHHFLLPVQN